MVERRLDQPLLIDPHCHLDDPLLTSSLEEAFPQALQAGVVGAIIPSYGPDRWEEQNRLLQGDPRFRLWAGFGLHPWAVETETPPQALLASLERGWQEYALPWQQQGQLVAVGEFGLDRVRRVPLPLQRAVFDWHLSKARQHDLPVILHLVRADGAAFELLEAGAPWSGVVHGFGSHAETVPRYLDLGLDLSFGSALLNSEKVRASLRATPLGRLMFETDAPAGLKGDFPSPKGPAFLIKIAEAASQILGKSVEYLLARHRENCARVFRLSPRGADSAPQSPAPPDQGERISP